MDTTRSKALSSKIYDLLEKHLSQDEKSQLLFVNYQQNPELYQEELKSYLHTELDQKPDLIRAAKQLMAEEDSKSSVFVNQISGGTIEQIINIAMLDQLNIEKRFFFFRDLKQLALAIIFLVGIGGSIVSWQWWTNQPRPMDGDFNIAVAQFGLETADGFVSDETATRISNSLFRFLDSEYKSSDLELDIQVTQKNIPIVSEDTQAESLADKLNANIVIYGYISANNSFTTVRPSFYVADYDQNLAELSGEGELATSIQVENLSSMEVIDVELREKTAILASFTKSLVYLSADRFEEAIETVERAIAEAEKVEVFKGQEILYLVSATCHRLLEDLDGALQNAEKALGLNTEYARAHIALGNVYYTRGIRNWSDTDSLDQALEAYEKARTVGGPPTAYIDEKVNVAVGNIYTIWVQQYKTQQFFELAVDSYTTVIEAYERSDKSYRQSLAAAAYYGLGNAYSTQAEDAKAIEAYTKCIEISEDIELKVKAQNRLDTIKEE